MLRDVRFKVDRANLNDLILESIELRCQVRLLRLHDTELDEFLADLSNLIRYVADVSQF